MNPNWDPSMARTYTDGRKSSANQEINRISALFGKSMKSPYGFKYDDDPLNNQSGFKSVLKNIISNTLTDQQRIQKRRKEELMGMLTDPNTGNELYVDLSMGSKYNFDILYAYSLEFGEKLKIETRFEYMDGSDFIELVVNLTNKVQILGEKRWEITKERMQEILYDLVYNQKEYDILAHPYMKDAHKQLLEQLLQNQNAFLEDTLTVKGIGLCYNSNNSIISFFNEIDLSMNSSSINQKAGVINVNDNVEEEKLNYIFYSPEYENQIIKFTGSNKAKFENEDKLPVEIKTAMPILRSQETIEKAEALNINRQYFFDTIINPIREVSRKQSIASQFADIDFDF